MKTTNAFSLVTGGMAATAGLAVATAAVFGNRRLRRQLTTARGEARHDRLTGLANRTRIDEELAARAAANDGFAVLLVDLDDFKPVNDTHGHAAGDLVLAEVARRLRAVVDEHDLVGRLGGDEFVILVDCPYGPISAMLARDVVAMVREPIHIGGGQRVTVCASVGWMQVSASDDVREALHAADTALYRVKAAGGNAALEYGPSEPLPEVSSRPLQRVRDIHPHRVPSELGVVIAR
jgi:diguanylate cyclase